MRIPRLEYTRHAAYDRIPRRRRLREWLTQKATALDRTASEVWDMLRQQGSTRLNTATTSSPVNRTIPAIMGTTTSGQTLTATTGAWDGVPNPTYAYAWLRNGVVVGGQTATTYLLSAPDVGTKISVRVTATNSAGSAQATSNETATVA